MKTKIVYVLTSSDKDIYLEQAFVSMFSVKQNEPDAHIVLLTDRLTHDTFADERRMSKTRYADEMVVVDLDQSLSAQQRSRILKTSVRSHIDGDFLFIDTDTIVVKSLREIDDSPHSVAAVWDAHCLFADNPYRADNINDGKRLGWLVGEEREYFNSGVIYAKDNEEARLFYQAWNKNMLESQRLGVKMDQPSFAKTNNELGHIVKALDGVWNCQYKHGMRFLNDAKIIHYLCTNVSTNKRQPFILNEEAQLLYTKRTSEISEEVRMAIENPFLGIPETVHVFSGEDLLFFQSKTCVLTMRVFQYKALWRVVESMSGFVYKMLKSLMRKS